MKRSRAGRRALAETGRVTISVRDGDSTRFDGLWGYLWALRFQAAVMVE